jgi:hypothetical protein
VAVHVPTDPDTEHLLSPATPRVDDLRTVFSVLVVLGKVFKQANPSLIPL